MVDQILVQYFAQKVEQYLLKYGLKNYFILIMIFKLFYVFYTYDILDLFLYIRFLNPEEDF